MSDWNFINGWRIRRGEFASTNEDGFNGAFAFPLPGVPQRICCIASDGGGWQHVSVTLNGSRKPPSWEIMAKVKDLFWEPTDWVVQFHPPSDQYVNNHPGCLHLWRCIDGREQPVPDPLMVGIKGAGEIHSEEEARKLHWDAMKEVAEREKGHEFPGHEVGP